MNPTKRIIFNESKRSLKNYNSLLHIISDIVIIVDGKGYLESLNTAGIHVFGLPYDDEGNKRQLPEIQDVILNSINLETGSNIQTIAHKIKISSKYYSACGAPFFGYNKERLFIILLKPIETITNNSDLATYIPGSQNTSYPSEHFGLIGSSRVFRDTLRRANQIAKTDSLVLVTGESGCGKEVIANVIKRESNRSKKPFFTINCNAISDSLLETELFGYEKGAFTGAHKKQTGIIEQCAGGTLLLDEIGSISQKMQAALLRVLETGEIRRVGSSEVINCDIRFIVLTNTNLRKAVTEGYFREDLFYRISIMEIEVPALRRRGNDSIDLAYHFCRKFQMTTGKTIEYIPKETLEKIARYRWPGNVRELENSILRAMITSQSNIINPEDLKLIDRQSTKTDIKDFDQYVHRFIQNGLSLKETMQAVERGIILRALKQNQFQITSTAKILAMPKQTLHRKIVKYQLLTSSPS